MQTFFKLNSRKRRKETKRYKITNEFIFVENVAHGKVKQGEKSSGVFCFY